VLAARKIARLPPEDFARMQQILADKFQHVPRVSIPKVVLAARVIALRPPVCIARRQQILAVMQHAPSTMVLVSIPKVVLAARVIALRPPVCIARH